MHKTSGETIKLKKKKKKSEKKELNNFRLLISNRFLRFYDH